MAAAMSGAAESSGASGQAAAPGTASAGVGPAPRAAHDRLDRLSRRWVLASGAVALAPLLLQVPGQLALGILALGVLVPLLAREGRTPGWLRLLLVVALTATVLSLYGFRFGRDTGCGLLAALLALKPVELQNRRDGRSLVGFALFAPFATFLLDQGPLSLLLGLAAAGTALAAMLRLSEAESGDGEGAGPLWRRLGAVARMTAIGLPVAMATFWLFPRLGTPAWGVPERALARPGLSDRMSPGEWLDIIGDETPALRVKFYGPAPARDAMYFRGPVLWNYDGRTWTASDFARALPPAPLRPGPNRYDYELEVEPTDRSAMVALDLLLAAPTGTRLDRDHTLRTREPLTALTRWRLQSAMPAAFEAELDPTLRARALRLPSGYNPRTLALGRRWRAEAGTGAEADAAIVARSLRWIRAEFGYTLETPLPGRDAVDEFLFDEKAGFCEHFSGAFVVLMRAAGVPARVVTGYAGGYRNPLGDYWLVRRSDAHAWAEVWLPARGWVRVDPTAAVAPERIYDTLDDRGAGGLAALPGLGGVGDLRDWLRRGWNDLVLGFGADRQRRWLQRLGVPDADAGKLALIFIVTLAIALGGMWWLATREERERDPVLRAWRRMERRYRRLGLARAPHEPGGRWAERVAAARPQSGEALIALSARFAAWRYARPSFEAAGTAPHPTQATSAGSLTERGGMQRGLIRDLLRHRP